MQHVQALLLSNMKIPLLFFPCVSAEVSQQSKSKQLLLFLHKLEHYMWCYLLIFFTAKPCIRICYLDCQLLGTFHNFFPLLAGDVVSNFSSIAPVGHQENFKFLFEQKPQ